MTLAPDTVNFRYLEVREGPSVNNASASGAFIHYDGRPHLATGWAAINSSSNEVLARDASVRVGRPKPNCSEFEPGSFIWALYNQWRNANPAINIYNDFSTTTVTANIDEGGTVIHEKDGSGTVTYNLDHPDVYPGPTPPEDNVTQVLIRIVNQCITNCP